MKRLMKVLRGLLLLIALWLFAGLSLALAAQPSKKDINDCATMAEQTAIKGCTAIIKKSPKNPNAQMAGYLNRGLAYQRLGQNDKAMADFDAGIKLAGQKGPTSADVAYNLYLNRGRLKYFSKDYRGSAADSEAATKVDATKPDAFVNWAYALLELDEFERANKEIWWALALRPDEPSALALSGMTNFYLGRYDKAMEETNRALELQSSFPWAQGNRALMHWWKDDLDPAMRDLDALISAQPTNAWALSLRARTHAMRNNIAEARRAVEAALAADPNLARAHFTKGFVDTRDGKADEARAAFAKAYELDATLTEALSETAALERAQGNLAKALEWYDRMIAAPVKSDQDKVRRDAAIAARAEVQEAIERPAKVAKLCLEGPAADVAAACKESLDLAKEPGKRLPFLLARLRTAKTLSDAEEIIMIEPRNYEARMARGWLLLGAKQRRPDDALKDFAVAREVEPKKPEPLVAAADAYLSLGDQAKALSALDSALALAPKDRAALSKKIWIHRERKEFKEAKAVVEQLTLAYPEDVFGWTTAATTLEALGDDTGAEKAATRAIELHPDLAVPKLVRGGVLFRRGDMAGAVSELSRALTSSSMRPDEARDARRMRARAFLATGNAAGAIEDAEKVLASEPGDLPMQSARASAYFQRGNLALALSGSADVLKADPKNADMHLLRIATRVAMKDFAQATKEAETAMAALPEDGRFIAARGEALLAQGRSKEALTDFNAARILLPADAKLALLTARANMDLGQADAALAFLASAPESAEALAIKGEALMAKTRLPAALDALEAAVKLDSGNIRALKLSGDLYAALGTNDLALQLYGKALARKPESEADTKLIAAAKEARARLIEKLAGTSAQ